MKNTMLILVAVVAMALSTRCTKPVYGCTDTTATNYDNTATAAKPSECTYQGSVVFWQNADNGILGISISSETGSVTKYYISGEPDCGSAGCATFTLPVGTYDFYATAGPITWSGQVLITTNNCTKKLIQ